MGEFNNAYGFFEQFARYFPASAVYKNIGLSYLRELIELNDSTYLGADEAILSAYKFPMRLESDLQIFSVIHERSLNFALDMVSEEEKKKRINQIKIMSEKAVNAFNRALSMKPHDKEILLYLSAAHLFADNLPMARGVLLGPPPSPRAATSAGDFPDARDRAHLRRSRPTPGT